MYCPDILAVSLERIRKEKGYTRAEVAAKLDISERHLYRLERGTTPVRRVYLLSLADLYEVKVADLERAA